MPNFKILNGRLSLKIDGRRARAVPGDIVSLSEAQAEAFGVQRLERIYSQEQVKQKRVFVTNPRAEKPLPAEYDVTEPAATMALEAGLDLSQIEGTGRDGKITLGDVKAAIAESE